MPATIRVPSSVSGLAKRFSRAPARTKKAILFVALVGVVLVAARGMSSSSSAAAPDPLAPALKLAQGTIDLEGSAEAIDSTTAATLLPLWQLLAELSSSGTAAPEEITAVIDEIQLNMTPAQIKAIDAMKISAGKAAATPRSGSTSASTSGSTAQVASTGGDPAMGGILGGDGPMGGGPMPSSSSQSSASTTNTDSAGQTPAVIRQVIQLLQSKVQG